MHVASNHDMWPRWRWVATFPYRFPIFLKHKLCWSLLYNGRNHATHTFGQPVIFEAKKRGPWGKKNCSRSSPANSRAIGLQPSSFPDPFAPWLTKKGISKPPGHWPTPSGGHELMRWTFAAPNFEMFWVATWNTHTYTQIPAVSALKWNNPVLPNWDDNQKCSPPFSRSKVVRQCQVGVTLLNLLNRSGRQIGVFLLHSCCRSDFEQSRKPPLKFSLIQTVFKTHRLLISTSYDRSLESSFGLRLA